MKYQLAKTATCKLAAAAILSCSLCSTVVLGQQLKPVQVETQTGLPPIVRASEMASEADYPPQSSLPNASLPPIVPMANVKLPEPTRVMIGPAGSTQAIVSPSMARTIPASPVQGSGFPRNAQEQIAEFIRNNETPDVANTAFVNPVSPEANRPSMAIMPLESGWQQDDSPSDFLSTDLSREVIPTPGLVTPHDYQSAPDNGAWMPNQTYSPSPAQSAGGSSYFQNAPTHNSTGEYGVANYSQASLDYGTNSDTFACCGFVCDASGYMVVDGLFWSREDGTFRAGNFTTVDDFDWTWGGRVTVGRRRDCTRGWEASYMQVDPWLAVNSQRNAAGQLFGAVFTNAGGLPPGAISAFRNSTFLEQFHKTDLNSTEINKTYWGADVAKAFIGARFIHFDDEFHLSSANTLGQQGIHNIDLTNNMFGVHVGGELLYDIGYRLAFSVSGKLGGYANFYRGRTGLLNNNTIHVNASRSDTDFSASGDFGAFARLKLGPRSRLKVGYEAMALWNVYDVESNFTTVVLPTAGQNYRDGDAFFHGLTMGLEIFR